MQQKVVLGYWRLNVRKLSPASVRLRRDKPGFPEHLDPPPPPRHCAVWKSQWNSVPKPRVARHELPWVIAPQSSLIALVKDLHDASPENRDFLRARFDAESAGGEALERYRRKIVEQFFPPRGFGKLKLAEARKAIRDYRKATGNVPGTIDLMLTYVENGTEFTQQFGDINAAYYNSLESVLNELAGLLRGEGREFYPQCRDRLARVEQLANHIGWGYGDYVREQVALLEDELAGP